MHKMSTTDLPLLEKVTIDNRTVERLLQPKITDELDKLIVCNPCNSKQVSDLIDSNKVTPSYKSVICALLSNNNCMYDVVYGKFSDMMKRDLEQNTRNVRSAKSEQYIRKFREDLKVVAVFLAYYGNLSQLKALYSDFSYEDFAWRGIFRECLPYAIHSELHDTVNFILSELKD